MIPSRVERPYREHYAITNCMKFKKDKCQILHVGQCNPGCTYRLGYKKLECSPAERDLGSLVDGKLKISQQFALVAKMANLLKEVIVPLYSAFVQGHVKYCVQFGALQCKKDIKINVSRLN